MSSRVRLHAPPVDARVVDAPSQEALDHCVDRVWHAAHGRGGTDTVQSRRDSAVEALNGAHEALETARAELLPEVTRDTVWLATEIARHVLRTEMAEGRYDLEAVVREVLEASGAGRAPCTVHLHPDDAAALESARFRAGTTLEEDVEVQRGDIHVSTPRGLMVRDLDDAIEAIREAILAQSQG